MSNIMMSKKIKWLLAGAGLLVVAAGVTALACGDCCCRSDSAPAGSPEDQTAAPFSLQDPARQGALEAPIDVEIEHAGDGIARVTVRFHRPATGVNVKAYGTEGVSVLGGGTPMRDKSVQAGDVESFQAPFRVAPHQSGLFAVHVSGLFEGTMHLAKASSVRVGEPGPQSGANPRHATVPGERIVTDSEGTRVHVMPAGK
ncbi:MAG: hypothetical protein P1V36_10510 [Planctomycetota bacterium]|nr:hypothetical protein [Planctomycetota bacterium]